VDFLEWGNNMNIPQMQQRWTGYSSEGSGSLLGAVLGARQASVSERQAGVAEANQKLKDRIFKDRIGVRRSQNKADKGIATYKINQGILKENAAEQNKYRNEYIDSGSKFFSDPWNYIFNQEKYKANREKEFDELVGSLGTNNLDQNQLIPLDPDASVNPNQVENMYRQSQMPESEMRSLLDLMLLNGMGVK
tara:strand:- start:1119 stop:1694 length:576 start_codon:yes stop_codon:yes gene_type:complete